jgi:isoamylase
LSQGVPMLLAGDEAGHSQRGNNNAYCQDNEISWIDWGKADQDLIEFTSQLIRLRRSHPAFSRKHWFQGRAVHGAGLTDIGWFLPDGKEMTEEHWNTGFAKSLSIFLYGGGLNSVDSSNQPIIDDNFYLLFNAHSEPIAYKLPGRKYGNRWKRAWDTSGAGEDAQYTAGQLVTVGGRSLVVLQSPFKPVKSKGEGKAGR